MLRIPFSKIRLRARRASAAPPRPGIPVVSTEQGETLVADRSAPLWARLVSHAFGALSGLCVLSVAFAAVFLHANAAETGNGFMAWLIGAVAAAPVLGILIVEHAHARALPGMRAARQRYGHQAGAALALIVVLTLAIVHPLLPAGLVAGAGLAWVGRRLLEHAATPEPHWDFRAAEAASALAGRDHVGFTLAARQADEYALWPAIRRVAIWGGVVITLAVTSWLAAREVVNLSSILANTLIAVWGVDAVTTWLDARGAHGDEPDEATEEVRAAFLPAEADELPEEGLAVRALVVDDDSGRRLLSEISFEVPPGTIVTIRGDAGAGKSLLLRALADPFSIPGTKVRGQVRLNGDDLWRRSPAERRAPLVHLPARPLILPASGADNLACFRTGAALEKGRAILERLVFAADAVEAICQAPDARRLPASYAKALALARAFLLGPDVYLIDRPEDGASDKLLRAISSRLLQERRFGRSILMVTEERSLAEISDRVLVLQEGRIIDYGDAEEIRRRMSSGWSRIVAARNLDSEDNLEHWIRALFKRDGDEGNRRKVAMVASELLALSCQSAERTERQTVTFEFRHFEGHCVLRMIDDDAPVSTAQLQRAKAECAREPAGRRLSPLANVLRESMEFDCTTEAGKRVIRVSIATYDPRKTKAKADAGDSQTTA